MPFFGYWRNSFFRSTKKSDLDTLHSINIDNPPLLNPITSGTSPLDELHTVSAINTPQCAVFLSHLAANNTSSLCVINHLNLLVLAAVASNELAKLDR